MAVFFITRAEKIPGLYGEIMFNLLGNWKTVVFLKFQHIFPPAMLTLCIASFKNDSRCKVVSQCEMVLISISLMTNERLVHLFFDEMSIQIFRLSLIGCLSSYWVIYCGYKYFIRYIDWQRVFFQSVACHFIFLMVSLKVQKILTFRWSPIYQFFFFHSCI